MAKRLMTWKTKGMNQDLSVSSFNPEFSFENMNLRLTTNEGNTLLSWVNEKGPSSIFLSEIKDYNGNDVTDQGIWGEPIGTAILNHKLVLFTNHSSGVASIYVFEYIDSAKTLMKGKLLYRGSLGLDINYPLETLASYEAEHILKIYWTDGKNQPRMINIAASSGKIKKWNATPGLSPFDFVPAFRMNEEVTITNHIGGGGLFAPGVILYAFTYINKYGLQSNLVYISPICHLSHSDRGASPEEKVTNSFEIRITNIDLHFDYVRLYSILRTSIDATPFVKHLDDIPVSGNTASEQFSRKLVYSSDASLTLPKDNNGSILTALVTNGSYLVNITPDSDTNGDYKFDNYEDIQFIGYNPNDHSSWHEIISLKEVISRMQAPLDFSDGESDEYYTNDYHTIITINQGFERTLKALATDYRSEYTFYGLKVGNRLIWGDETYGGFPDKSFIYNYADKKWYITSGEVTETVTENPVASDGIILYTDNGTTGATLDPAELLYVGGKEITALTMAEKDQTLFLGNIEQKNSLVTYILDYFDSLRGTEGAVAITFKNDGGTEQEPIKHLTLDSVNGVYGHTNQLKWDRNLMSTFKGGETYRFGFLLLKNTGEWSEPIFIDDKDNSLYPVTHMYLDTINLVYAEAELPIGSISGFNYNVFKRIRPVIVYPNIGDRTVICQGVLNPTVFNVLDRVDNTPFALASWFFRPFMSGSAEINSATELVNINELVVPAVTTPLPTSINLDVDEFFLKGLYVQNVGILIADVEDDMGDLSYDWTAHNPLLTGEIMYWFFESYQGDPDPRTDTIKSGYDAYSILGIIKLGTGGTYNTWYDSATGTQHVATSTRYAFVLPDLPDKEHITSVTYSDGATMRSELTYTNIHYKAASTEMFKMFQNLKGLGHFLYYTKPLTDAPDNYHFKFWVKDTTTNYEAYVDVNFSSAFNESGYFPELGDNQGDALRYKHYDNIFAQSEVTASTGYNNTYYNQARQVEIQGSKNIYVPTLEGEVGNRHYISPVFVDDSYNTVKNAAGCNGQFFIDLSIVTLNSPDLEFDTDVLNYNAEGLELRIIGAIPITANVSAHSILTGAMEIEGFGEDRPGTVTGTGEINTNVIHYNISRNAGKRLISELLWNDAPSVVDTDKETGFYTSNSRNFYIHPWHKSGSIANDPRKEGAGSVLLKKKMSQLLYSKNTEYLPLASRKIFLNINYETLLTENSEIINARLPKQKKTATEINYYPNIDKLIVNENGYGSLGDTTSYPFNRQPRLTNPVSMKYKSTTHAVIAFYASSMEEINTVAALIPLLPYVVESSDNYGKYDNPTALTFPDTFWGDLYMTFTLEGIDVQNLFMYNNTHIGHNLLWLGEIYKKTVSNRFGGTSKEAIRNNKWLIAGEAVKLHNNDGTAKSTVKIRWTYGDTYFQRYDCLKTYAYTQEDTNLNIEILSFMCETHVNIEGRYDRNRGLINNLNMSPLNFNLVNSAYSQLDNFFTSRKLDYEDIESLVYPNLIIWSKTKDSGADIDLWTNITLANSLELDGDKGLISSLNRLNDQLICFQDLGVSLILYNENTLISTSEGVPIEIANSGKVLGKRYLSDTIGCSNKWSIVNTPNGIYFMDSNDKAIYLLGSLLLNISDTGGFNAWCKKLIPAGNVKWNPIDFNNFRGLYDKLHLDVLFINKDIALAWNEKLKTFTSFYNYQKAPYFCNLDDTGVWVHRNNEYGMEGAWELWKHHGGIYGLFFKDKKPYWMILVGNPEPQVDKIFTNLEFRACTDMNDPGDTNLVPFDYIETWNEYQHGFANLSIRNGHDMFKHHTSDNNANLARKFRIWRCDIPRDNADNNFAIESAMGIFRTGKRPTDRMRNPWIYIKLYKDMAGYRDFLRRSEIHDIAMTYF